MKLFLLLAGCASAPPPRTTMICGTLEADVEVVQRRRVEVTLGADAPTQIAGLRAVEPDAATAGEIEFDPDDVAGALAFCVDATGKPEWVMITESTRYPAYDQALVDAVHTWRFMPHEVAGEYVASCSTATVLLRR